MTDAETVKQIIASCPEQSCIRCKYGYVVDDDTYPMQTLANLNIHTCCHRMNAHRMHIASFVHNQDRCKKYEPATCIFVFPPVTKKMMQDGKWWTDRERINNASYTLDRWIQ